MANATGPTAGIPDDSSLALTRDAAFLKRMGRPEDYARMATTAYKTTIDEQQRPQSGQQSVLCAALNRQARS